MLVALRREDVIEIGLGMAPRAGELRGRAGLDVGQEVHLAVAHRSISSMAGLRLRLRVQLPGGMQKPGKAPRSDATALTRGGRQQPQLFLEPVEIDRLGDELDGAKF